MKNILKTTTILSLALILGACSVPSSSTSTSQTSNTEELSTTVSTELTPLVFSAEDLNTDYNPTTVTTITFNGSKITSDGASAQVDGSTLSILDEGDYILSGSSLSANIIISAESTDNVHLLLNNLDLTSSTGSPLVVLQADKTIITLVAGTQNRLEDASTYVQTEEEPNATLYSKDDLTLNGKGSLELVGNFNHGLFSKNDLKILDASLTVTALNDGLKGKDLIAIRNANLTLNVGGDGLQASNAESSEVGNILIESGTFDITAGLDGLQAENRLEIQSGSFTINSGEASSSESSGKALKAVNLVLVEEGNFTLTSKDDAIHSNLDVYIAGGTFDIESGDDGIHADQNLSVLGGDITILDAYEGFEATNILISGGDHALTTYDDGINGSNGVDGSASTTPQGKGDMFASDGSTFTITGGTLVVNAQGDGLDSNGSISMSGGTVIVFGPTDNGNGPLDYNDGFILTGGTLLAVGSSGMAMNVSESSQNSVLINFDGVAAGERLSLIDSNGTIIASVLLPKAVQSFLYSGSNLSTGDYQLVSGGDLQAEGLVTNGTLTNTSLLESVAISEKITSIGAASMGQPGQGQPGQGGPRPSRN